MTRLFHAIALAAATFFVPPAYAQEAASPGGAEDLVKSVELKVGDSWVYKIMNELTNQQTSTNTYTITEISPANVTVFVKVENEKGEEKGFPAQFTPSWGIIRYGDLTYSKPDLTFGVSTPFKVGSKWQSSFDMRDTRWPTALRTTSSSKVVARETIKLPSGEDHDAYKIESEMIGKTRDGVVRLSVKATVWYAPAVNRYVQRVAETRNNGLLSRKEKEYLISFTSREN